MALTKTVEESLREAQSHLRNALAFSARSEEPYISKHIADYLNNIESLISAIDLIERADKVIKELEE